MAVHTKQHQEHFHFSAAGVYYFAFDVCFLLCKCIDLARVHTGPCNLKIPVCVRWELQHGSLLQPASRQEVQFVGGGEGLQMTEDKLAFPAQHSQAQLIS